MHVDCELLMLQTDKGMDVIVENLADVNIDKDIELAGLDGRIAVSKRAFLLLVLLSLFRVCIFCITYSQCLTTESAVQRNCSLYDYVFGDEINEL